MRRFAVLFLILLLCVPINAQIIQNDKEESFRKVLASYTVLYDGLSKDMKTFLGQRDYPYEGTGIFFLLIITDMGNGTDATEMINILAYRVLRDSPAGQAGIKPGSIIRSINGGSMQVVLKKVDGLNDEARLAAGKILFDQLSAFLLKDKITVGINAGINQKSYTLARTEVGSKYGKYIDSDKASWQQRLEQNATEAKEAMAAQSLERLEKCLLGLTVLEKNMYPDVYFVQ